MESLAESPRDWTSELMVFNTMKPETDETLLQFHLRLVEQAKKCNFRCKDCESSYQERNIRDRLILFVEKSLLKEITTTYANPTTQQILDIYEEDQKLPMSPGWPIILSYVTLTDLESVSRSHPKFKAIVDTQLQKGLELVIDDDTVWKYPIDQNHALYSKYAPFATNLVIKGIHEFDLAPLLKLFPNKTKLTLMYVQRNMVEREDFVVPVRREEIVAYPESVRHLCVIYSNIDLNTLIDQMHGLESLHIEGRLSSDLKIKRYLSEITLKVPKGTGIGFAFPIPKRLAIDSSWLDLLPKELMQKVEHLRVLGSVDWKVREHIEALNLKSVEVHYSEIPTEENLILRLNTDCLMMLQKYLSADDWMAFHESHPRFQLLPIKQYVLTNKSYDLLPVAANQSFYERIGPLVFSLRLYYLQYNALLKLMPFFTNLCELEVDNTSFSRDLMGTHSSLRRVILKTYQVRMLPKEFFRGVKTTLESLEMEIEADYVGEEFWIEGFEELQNIKEFKTNRIEVTEEFLRFLRTNQGHMRKLEMYTICPEELAEELWLIVVNMPSLQELTIGCSVSAPRLPAGCLPQLEKLCVRGTSVCFEQFLMALDCSELKSFCFEGRFDIGVDISLMKNLEVLKLKDYAELNYDAIPKICELTNLKECSVNAKDEVILPLIKNLSHLDTLNTFIETSMRNPVKIDVAVIQKIRKYLKEANREICINSIYYP